MTVRRFYSKQSGAGGNNENLLHRDEAGLAAEGGRVRTIWYSGELYVLNRNRAVALLIAKADRADRFWAAVEGLIRRVHV